MHLNISLLEIQANSLEEVATFSLNECVRNTRYDGIFVEDAGLFIDSLNGFPGPYSAFILRTIGLNGVLDLMENKINRSAIFQSTIALRIKKQTKLFTGKIKGEISRRISDLGWGYDPIFIPEGYIMKTFGELGEEKNLISHRFLATQKLIQFLNAELLKGDMNALI